MILQNRLKQTNTQNNDNDNDNNENENKIHPKNETINYYLTITGNYILHSGKIIIKVVIFTIKISGVYLMWILLHYFASQLYVKLCTPSSVFGFIMSPFLTTTPYCQGLRWVIYNGAIMINNMWIFLATWLCANVFILNNNNTNANANENSSTI